MYYRKKHHHFRNAVIVILLLAIGGGSAYYYHQSNSNQASPKTTRQANQGQGNSNQKQVSHHSHWNKVPVNHKNTNSNNKVKQTMSKPVNKPGYTLSVLPKNIQGMWYSYDNGKLDKLVIMSNKIIFNGHVEQIHARSKNANAMKAKNHPNWGVATSTPKLVRGEHYTNVRGWNQTAGDGDNYAYFICKDMPVLNLAGGAADDTDANFYRTPQQAKQNKRKIFKSFGEQND